MSALTQSPRNGTPLSARGRGLGEALPSLSSEGALSGLSDLSMQEGLSAPAANKSDLDTTLTNVANQNMHVNLANQIQVTTTPAPEAPKFNRSGPITRRGVSSGRGRIARGRGGVRTGTSRGQRSRPLGGVRHGIRNRQTQGRTIPQNRLQNRMVHLKVRENLILNKVNQFKQALKLQQETAKQLGSKLSSADLQQLQKQETVFIKRIDNLTQKLLQNNQKLEALQKTLDQTKATASEVNANRMRRLEQIQQMLKEGQELSARLLNEMQEMLGSETEDGVVLGRGVRRKTSGASKKSEQKDGHGLRVQEDPSKVETKKRQEKAESQAQEKGTKVVKNTKTGNMIVSNAAGPKDTLDINSSVENDSSGNDFTKELEDDSDSAEEGF